MDIKKIVYHEQVRYTLGIQEISTYGNQSM